MKDIAKFINESVKKPKQELYQYVDVWVDEQYQEGLVNYDDDHIEDYATGKTKPNYNEILKGVMEEFKSEISSHLKAKIENFLKEKEHTSSESKGIIDIIDLAIGNFASTLKMPGY